MEIHWEELVNERQALAEMGASGRTLALKDAATKWSARSFEATKSSEEPSPAKLGRAGELEVLDALRGSFSVVDCSKTAKNGDLLVMFEGRRLVVEVKNWEGTVTKRDIDKFFRDLDCSGANAGLMVSLKSDFCKFGSFWLDDGTKPFILVNCNHRPELATVCAKFLFMRLNAPLSSGERHLQSALASVSRLTQLGQLLAESEATIKRTRGLLAQTQKDIEAALALLMGEGEAVDCLATAALRFPRPLVERTLALFAEFEGSCSVRVSPCAIHVKNDPLQATITPNEHDVLLALRYGQNDFSFTLRSAEDLLVASRILQTFTINPKVQPTVDPTNP